MGVRQLATATVSIPRRSLPWRVCSIPPLVDSSGWRAVLSLLARGILADSVLELSLFRQSGRRERFGESQLCGKCVSCEYLSRRAAGHKEEQEERKT